MKTEKKKLEAISTKNKGIKYDGEWKNVVGKAVDHLKNLVPDVEADISLDDKGQVIFIKQEKPAPDTRNDVIARQTCAKIAGRIECAYVRVGKEYSPTRFRKNAEDALKWVME